MLFRFLFISLSTVFKIHLYLPHEQNALFLTSIQYSRVYTHHALLSVLPVRDIQVGSPPTTTNNAAVNILIYVP